MRINTKAISQLALATGLCAAPISAAWGNDSNEEAVITNTATSLEAGDDSARTAPSTATPSAIDQVSKTEIIVTAQNREALREMLSPGAVSVIYPDDTRGEHKALPDLLDQIPGVYVRRVAGTGQYTTTSIRGSAPSQVNIYVDGVPFNTSGEVAVDISTIPISNVERIEVYRGMVPARFAGAPLGGAINIVTKRPRELLGAVSGGVRSLGGWQASANINVPVLGGSLLLGADAEGSTGNFRYTNTLLEQGQSITRGIAPDGNPIGFYDQYCFACAVYNELEEYYYPVRNPSIEKFYPKERRRLNNSFEKYNGIALWSHDNFSVKYSFSRMKRYMPAVAAFENTDLPEYTFPLSSHAFEQPHVYIANPRRRQIQAQHDVAVGWNDSFGDLEISVSLNAMDQHKKYRNLELVGTNGIGRQWSDYRTRRYGSQLDLAYTLGANAWFSHYLEVHVQGSQETMYADANDREGAVYPERYIDHFERFRRHLFNVQVQDTITIHPLGDLEITPVGRVDRLWGPVLGPKQNLFGPSSGDYKWLPTFGIGGKKNFGNFTIFSNTGTYNRYPNFYEIYGDGVFIQAGSSNLGNLEQLLREYGRNSDVGIGWNGMVSEGFRTSLRAIGFARETNNTITLYSTPVGAKYINSGTTLTRGIELEGNFVFSKIADIQAAYTYQNGRYKTGTYYYFGASSALSRVGDEPLYTINNPRVVANARLNLHFLDGALTTFGEVRHTGKRYTYQGTKEDGSKGFNYDTPLTTFDFGAHFKTKSGFAISAGVMDVFNQQPKQTMFLLSNNRQMQYYTSVDDYHDEMIPGVNPNVLYPQQGRTFYLTLAKNFGPGYAPNSSELVNDLRRSNQSWSGFYLGGAVGHGWASAHSGEGLVFDTNNDGAYMDVVQGDLQIDINESVVNSNAFFTGGYDGRGRALGRTREDGIVEDRIRDTSYAFRLGYDRQIGDWLIGGLFERAQIRLRDSVSGYGASTLEKDPDAARVIDQFFNSPESYTFTRELKSTTALRMRGGYIRGNLLGYVTGGVAVGDVHRSFETTNTRNQFDETDASNSRWGIQAGTGIEAQISGPFTIGVEYLYTRLKDGNLTVFASGYEMQGYGFQPGPNGGGTHIRRGFSDYTLHALRVTAGFRF